MWANEINPNGNYGASFADWPETSIAVPDSAFDSTIMCNREDDADFWLDFNWQYYENYAAIIVVDDWGQDDDSLGCAPIGGAGYDGINKTAIIDARDDRNGTLPSYLENVRSEGIAAHELGHLYNAVHSDGSTQNIWFNPDESSMLAVPSDPIECTNNGSVDERIQWYSDCTVGQVQGHIDDTDSIEPV